MISWTFYNYYRQLFNIEYLRVSLNLATTPIKILNLLLILLLYLLLLRWEMYGLI